MILQRVLHRLTAIAAGHDNPQRRAILAGRREERDFPKRRETCLDGLQLELHQGNLNYPLEVCTCLSRLKELRLEGVWISVEFLPTLAALAGIVEKLEVKDSNVQSLWQDQQSKLWQALTPSSTLR